MTKAEKTLKEIIQVSNTIRKKFGALKRGKVETEELLQETFKPVTEPLKEIVKQIKPSKAMTIKKQKIDSDTLNFPKAKLLGKRKNELPIKYYRQPNENLDKTKTEASFLEDEYLNKTKPEVSFLEDEEVFESEPEEAELTIADPDNELEQLEQQFGNIAGSYLFHFATAKDSDTAYGVRFQHDRFMIGNSPIEIEHNDIKVGDKWYKGTYGLYELLFKKRPLSYEKEDENNYLNIALKTNVHRRNYDSNGAIKGSQNYKYLHIIKPYITTGGAPYTSKSQSVGFGLMNYTNFKREYVYWDDPNELVDRLRLLLASKSAGHTGHNNEIMSIVEELREANIIV